MTTHTIGIAMHGVTGRMGTNQHLVRSIMAIIRQGGVQAGEDTIMPRPLLVGRNADKLESLAGVHTDDEPLEWTTSLDDALGRDDVHILFDAASTSMRPEIVKKGVDAGKAIYCEKPTALTLEKALDVWRMCEAAGVKHGVVQDKLFLPGIARLRHLRDSGFFGRILSVRGSFGYWVFTGHDPQQPAQRPSWNYRAEDGGGIIGDMFCHWRYVLDDLIGPVSGVMAVGSTDIPERIDERGKPYACTADDAAYAVFKAGDVLCQFNSSWTTRVRRDDLLTLQVDGTDGSAVAGLRQCRVQSITETPRPVWNPDLDQPIDFHDGWQRYDDGQDHDNAFKVQWEMFLQHVALDEPWRHGLLEGAKGVQLAEAGQQSWRERRWIDLEDLA